MQSIFNTTEFLMIFALREGIAVLIFLQLVSLRTIRNKKGNSWMAFFFLTLVIILMNDNDFLHAIGIKYTALINRILFIPNLITPTLFYFAILYYVNPTRSFIRKDIAYFLPWLIHLVMILPFLVNPEIKNASLGWYNYALFYKYFIEGLFIVFAFLVLFQLHILLKKHEEKIKMVHSFQEGIDLLWVRKLIIVVPFFLLAYIFLAIIDTPFFYNFGVLLLTAVLVYMGYHIVKQKEIYPYLWNKSIQEKALSKEEKDSQNKNQLLSQAQMQALAKKLEVLMANQKLFLDPNLNLYQLSSLIELRTQELSFLLNNYFQVNFYTYINNYRIEESKKNLSDPEKKNLSMVGIAIESGFKSKSTFYSRFKEATGMSPTEYLKQNKQ